MAGEGVAEGVGEMHCEGIVVLSLLIVWVFEVGCGDRAGVCVWVHGALSGE